MNVIALKKPYLLFGLLSLSGAACAESNWDFSGNIELESRYFVESPQFDAQDDQKFQNAVDSTLEFRWRNNDGNQRISIIPYLRWDAQDNERSLVDLQESYWALESNNLELLVGINTVFWGVTESVHLVDIINQTDSVADIDGEQKLGQAMINLAWQQDWGLLNVFVLPGFRERTFAGIEGRLRTPVAVDNDRANFESGADKNHVDFALRYSHYIGDFDIGISYFSGTSREARFTINENGTQLIPIYDQINQLGFDGQYTKDAWLWKLEAIVRQGHSDTFVAAIGGFEYTQYQIFDTNADLGYLLEYQYDDRDDEEPLSIADNDIFAGARLALNDPQDTSVLAGIVYDHESDEVFLNVEAETRIGDNYTITGRARFINNTDSSDALDSLSEDDYIEISIARYF
ncbi:hypothetical protein [Sessilibacter corallicola]|uniref:hypothetical protein n=1 Tax=Sessilibacter corallicola TaxID=2904075 RepID=UPI001E3E37C8|nr:hypothetical protein [Sessilibacter corallicola]MCE2027290.1 hypothetical protein [Sessilibacter corallicola]